MNLGTKLKIVKLKIVNSQNKNCTIKTRSLKTLTSCFFNYKINNVIIFTILYTYIILRKNKDKLI